MLSTNTDALQGPTELRQVIFSAFRGGDHD